MKVLFLDTNVYLHCRLVEDIDWPRLVGTDSVEIVVPRVTLRELEKKKNNAPPKIQGRARSVLKKLEAWLENEEQEIRPGVRVHLYATVPSQQQIESFKLNPGWEDDVLLATICNYRQLSTNQDVFIVTQDVGLRLSAKNQNIAVFRLPDEYRLPSELDPLEKENRELQRRVQLLENAAQKLDILLATDACPANSMRWKLPQPQPYPAEENKRILEGLRKGYSESQYFDRKECEEYFESYETYLKDRWKQQKAVKLLVSLRFVLVNTGTKPGDDIDCHFLFPNRFDLHADDELKQLMAKPIEPVPPLRLGDKRTPKFERSSSTFVNVSGLSIRRSDGYNVHKHVPRIKHGEEMEVVSMNIQFKDYETAAPFGVDYHVSAANLPEQVTGKLHVIIEKD